MDQLEAQTSLAEVLAGKSLVELYDSVLVPALAWPNRTGTKAPLTRPVEEFLFLGINEMVVELSEHARPDGATVSEATENLKHRVLCLPAL
jgi:hypothetical protein